MTRARWQCSPARERRTPRPPSWRCLDNRFDFSHTYWLVAGIAGGCPDRVSLGSALWARWVVDADLSYEIDAREIPPDWTTGYLPLRKAQPFEQPAEPQPGQAYERSEENTS